MAITIKTIIILLAISVGCSSANICDGVTDFAKVRNAEDCGTYFLCYTNSVPLLIVCAGDHEFNSRTGFCDLPGEAQCVVGEETTTVMPTTTEARMTTTIEPTTTTETTTTTTEATTVTTEITTEPTTVTTPNPSLPNCNSSIVSWEPHTYSCSKYFLCFHGNPIEKDCAPGLHFSSAYRMCMLPELANCEVDRTCPSVDDEQNPVLFPDIEDCRRYFLCFNGSPIARQCAEGLFWDVNHQWCTFPEIVHCDSRTENDPARTTTVAPTTEPTTELPTTTTELTTTTTTTELTTTTEDPNKFQCPINSFVTLHPHPAICEFYFICYRGTGHLMECAEGLSFDATINQCLDKSEAVCILELNLFN